jgi:hypothetical protein
MVTKVEEKVWSLAFAKHLVIAAKSEREMKEIRDSSEEKKLEVNVEKTKLMVFNKRKRKSEENKWNRKEGK